MFLVLITGLSGTLGHSSSYPPTKCRTRPTSTTRPIEDPYEFRPPEDLRTKMFSTLKNIESPHEVVGAPLCGKSWIRASQPEISLTTVTEELGVARREPAPKGCCSEIVLTGSEVHSPTSLISLCKGKQVSVGLPFNIITERYFTFIIGSEMRQSVLYNY